MDSLLRGSCHATMLFRLFMSVIQVLFEILFLFLRSSVFFDYCIVISVFFVISSFRDFFYDRR